MATGWLFCRPESPNAEYEVKVRVVDKNNRMAYSTIQISTRDLATSRLLSDNFPNPFTGETTFRIIVPEKSAVLAEIYDLRGRKIAVLCDDNYVPAEYKITWDGTNTTVRRFVRAYMSVSCVKEPDGIP